MSAPFLAGRFLAPAGAWAPAPDVRGVLWPDAATVSARDPVPEHAVVSVTSSAATPTSDLPGLVVNVDSLFIGSAVPSARRASAAVRVSPPSAGVPRPRVVASVVHRHAGPGHRLAPRSCGDDVAGSEPVLRQ